MKTPLAFLRCLPRSLSPSLSLSLPLSLSLLLSLFVSASTAHAATISGNVSNLATGNLLQGARVEIPALGVSALVDETGRYVLGSVPAGTHELVVTYTGLDTTRATVAVTADQTATRNFDLTTGIYKLEQFKVKGEREGDASALTAARNAENLKNVAATDSFGNLPNMNAGEVAIRLPGIYGELDAGGNLSGFNVRGMAAGLNSVTMDGGLMTGQGGLGRSIFVITSPARCSTRWSSSRATHPTRAPTPSAARSILRAAPRSPCARNAA
jgi:hypothetical protein